MSFSAGSAAFTPVQPLKTALYGAAAWGDYDGDGDLDLVVQGSTTVDPPYVAATTLYRNDAGTLVDVEAGLAGLHSGAVAWGDYDLDGDLDLLLTGEEASERYRTVLYRNEGAGRFAEVETGFPGVGYSDAAWGDYDGDGDLDVALAGVSDEGFLTVLYRNGRAAGFERTADDLVDVAFSTVAWGDYDGDGDPDLALSGRAEEGLVTRIYRNDAGPSGTAFVEVQALRGVQGGNLSWGDFDGDADLDLLASGGVLDPFILRGTTTVYRNEGGHFAAHDVGVEGTMGSTLWGDYDEDGDLDLLVSRMENVLDSPVLLVYENVGGTYRPATFGKGFILDTTLWYDANGDGRPDILTMGSNDPDVGYFYLDMTRFTF